MGLSDLTEMHIVKNSIALKSGLVVDIFQKGIFQLSIDNCIVVFTKYTVRGQQPVCVGFIHCKVTVKKKYLDRGQTIKVERSPHGFLVPQRC